MRERGLFNRQDTSAEDPPNSRPIGDVVRDMVGHIAEIIRSEMRLATMELRQEVVELKAAAIAIAVGNVLLIYGGIFVLLGVVFALSTIWPPWVAALVVGGSLAVIGAIVLQSGIHKIKNSRRK
jgi:uncharacterized membrane protein YqjE